MTRSSVPSSTSGFSTGSLAIHLTGISYTTISLLCGRRLPGVNSSSQWNDCSMRLPPDILNTPR